jgi:hypothetical protein
MMRAVLLVAGLLLSLAVGFIVGVAAERVGEETDSAPPRTVTVERTVERTVTVPAPTTTTTAPTTTTTDAE